MNKYLKLLFLIVILHLIFVSFSIKSSFYGDEVFFIRVVDSIVSNNSPITNHSFMHLNDDGLWHPPLYIYLLSIPARLWGDNSLFLRSISIIFNIGVILLVYFFSLFLLGKENEKWALLAVAFYALNPLTIQSSIILDIDGGVLNFFTLLFAFLFVKGKNSIYLILSFLLVLWTKFTGVVIIIGALFFYSLIYWNLKDLKKNLFVIISGIALFLFQFLLYTNFLGLRFMTPFEHSSILNHIHEIIKNTASTVSRSVWSVKLFFYFAVPLFILLFFILSYHFIKNRLYKQYKEITFVWLMGMVTILFFLFIGPTGWNFPKYYITALPFISIFSAFALNKLKVKIAKKDFAWIIILLIVIPVYLFFTLGDPLIPEIQLISGVTSFSAVISAMSTRLLFYFVVPIIIGIFVMYKSKTKNKFVVLLCVLTFVLYLYLGVLQATASYSTHNLYGTEGIRDTVSYFKENNISAENIATYPDIGYYIGYNRYYDLTFVYNDKVRLDEWVLNNEKVEYIVMLEKDFGRIGEENLGSFEGIKQIGDYYILKRK